MADKTLERLLMGIAHYASQNAVYVKINTAVLTEWKLALETHIAAMGEPVAIRWKSSGRVNRARWVYADAASQSIPPSGGEMLYTAPPASGDWDAVRNAVPTNWLDPMLTGPNAVIGKGPYDCNDIERVLGVVRQKLTAALPKSQP